MNASYLSERAKRSSLTLALLIVAAAASGFVFLAYGQGQKASPAKSEATPAADAELRARLTPSSTTLRVKTEPSRRLRMNIGTIIGPAFMST